MKRLHLQGCKNRGKQGTLYIILSFDDTHYLNGKCANLLDKYNLKGTFYIDVLRLGKQLADDIRHISERHEIGSHSMTHRDLTRLPLDEVRSECKRSKEMLEAIIGKPVESFAYPYGRFNSHIVKILKECGYTSARSTIWGNIDIDDDPFALKVTLTARPYGFKEALRLIRSLGVFSLSSLHQLRSLMEWDVLSKYVLEKLHRDVRNGWNRVFHLHIHAGSIELENKWDQLEEILNMISSLSYSKNLTITDYVNECGVIVRQVGRKHEEAIETN